MKIDEVIGKKFGMITVLSLNSTSTGGFKTRSKRHYLNCACDCGKEVVKRLDVIGTLGSKSCGCIRKSFHNSAIRKLFTEYRTSAKRRGHEFSIDEEFIKDNIFKNCHYCGIEPSREKTVNSDTIIYNGLDRKDNSVGYVEDNLVTCCTICNAAKHTLSYEEFMAWIERLRTCNPNQ